MKTLPLISASFAAMMLSYNAIAMEFGVCSHVVAFNNKPSTQGQMTYIKNAIFNTIMTADCATNPSAHGGKWVQKKINGVELTFFEEFYNCSFDSAYDFIYKATLNGQGRNYLIEAYKKCLPPQTEPNTCTPSQILTHTCPAQTPAPCTPAQILTHTCPG